MFVVVDWIIANMLAVRQGSLGHIRYVLKSDLKWIPLYGFYFEQVEKDSHRSEVGEDGRCFFSMAASMFIGMTRRISIAWNKAFVK